MTEHRPPTILGPYGEGYCRHCRFVLGLDEQGLINWHKRGIGSYGQAQDCKGSGTRPPKLTPYSSRASVFISKPRRAACPTCGRQEMPVLADGRLAGHLADPYRPGSYCKGGYTTPPGRGHGSERG